MPGGRSTGQLVALAPATPAVLVTPSTPATSGPATSGAAPTPAALPHLDTATPHFDTAMPHLDTATPAGFAQLDGATPAAMSPYGGGAPVPDPSWIVAPGTRDDRFATTASVASLGGVSKRKLMIGGGVAAGLLLVIVIAAAAGGGSDDAKPTTTAAIVDSKDEAKRAAMPDASVVETVDAPELQASTEPDAGSAESAAGSAADVGSGSGEVATTTDVSATPAGDPKPSTGRAAVSRTPTGRKPATAGTSRPARVAVRPPARDPAKARAAYDQGTKRFIAGDTAGAIRSYREAVKQQPKLAVAHRQLGLAYEKAGDKANAVKSLRAYVLLAPSARDSQLIRKRIRLLQAR